MSLMATEPRPGAGVPSGVVVTLHGGERVRCSLVPRPDEAVWEASPERPVRAEDVASVHVDYLPGHTSVELVLEP